LVPTDQGSQFHDTLQTTDLDYAESYYPYGVAVVSRDATIDFALVHNTATNLKKMLNGATVATAGSGATLLSTLTPPVIGSEVSRMIGWESNDHTIRLVAYQALQIGSVEP